MSAPTVKIIDYDDFNSVILTLYCLSKILEESLLCHNSDFNMDIQKTWQARLKFLQIDESDQTKMAKKEVFISVDIEASGPIPGEYDLLSIGMCLVDQPEIQFYCELKPVSHKADPKALAVSGFNLEDLTKNGIDPTTAMQNCATWLEQHLSKSETPIFVGLNAGFDWSFMNYYFHKFIGHNPFGVSSLDIKSLYMGAFGGRWSDTRAKNIIEILKPQSRGNHNALQDAIFQAELFRLILKQIQV
ncbi:hypothetical protein F899_02146 [Acinetobacter sp. CIP 101934]|uniref:3'-5' exonuclease n=1 Tax=Acinetobacter TaxID=469 RepID=UPI0002D0F338|nr:hypothetical protein F899_02146 [Acinetobacter sp. CIP 101934]OIJ37825.1 DNA polymerase III subunit epsilon [Acinetobacter sp. LCT-H3]